jgi:hypothetical protein
MYQSPAHKSLKPLTPRERALGLTSAASRPLFDWVGQRKREGKPRNDHARERIVSMRMLIAEADADLAKLLEDE